MMSYARRCISQINLWKGAVNRLGNESVREVALHSGITFVSTLLIQGTTFFIIAVAALSLPVSEFARLSLLVATVMLASAAFELGVNFAATKYYLESGDERYLVLGFSIRQMLFALAVMVGGTLTMAGPREIGFGIVLGALLNLWNGIRATDQAREDYSSVVRSSSIFAGLRIAAGCAALTLFESALATAVALYAIPLLACGASSSAKFMWKPLRAPRPGLDGATRYAFHVYLNAITFIALPYVPQFFIASRLQDVAVGTYGIILTFSAPVGLVIYSLRSVLLPKMLGRDSLIEQLLWSRRGAKILALIWVALMVAGAFLAWVMGEVYVGRFPELRSAFLIYFTSFSLTAVIGFYSLSVHTAGVPEIASVLGLIKLFVLVGAIALFGYDLTSLVIIVGAVMVMFEIMLAILLVRKVAK